MKLLIADDEENIREGLRDNISWKELGFEEVFTAANGLEAFEIYDAGNPQIIITDIKMPGMDGLELSREIRRTDKKIPIIILSGHSEFEYARDALAMEVITYLLKPVNIKELTETVSKAIEKVHDIDELERSQKKQLKLEIMRFTENLFNGKITDADLLKESLIKYYGFSGKCNIVPFIISREDMDRKRLPAVSQWLGEKPHIIYETDKSVIVLYEDPEAGRLKIVRRELLRLFDILISKGKISLSCAGSGTCAEIGSLIDRSESMLFHRLYKGTGCFLFGDELQEAANANYSYQIEKPELKDFILKYDYRSSIGILKTTFADLVDQKCINRRLIQNICFAYKNLLLQTLNLESKEIKLLYDLDLSQSSIVPEFITIDEYSKWISSIYRAILSEFSERHGVKYNSTAYKAMIYMKEHFSEDLDVETLANHVELSPDYFSRIFKKEMGCSFIQYLNKMRIGAAKKLLNETNLLAYEISEKVGYNNYKYFVRVFKDMEGFSPSQLRK